MGADEESGLVYSVVIMAAKNSDIPQVDQLLRGEEHVVCADFEYTEVEKRPEHEGRAVIWQIVAGRSIYKKHGKCSALYKALRKIEKAKAKTQVPAEVEQPFRLIKRQFGYMKEHVRGLAKHAAQMVTLFSHVESVDGPPTFAGHRKRGAPVKQKMATVKCWRYGKGRKDRLI